MDEQSDYSMLRQSGRGERLCVALFCALLTIGPVVWAVVLGGEGGARILLVTTGLYLGAAGLDIRSKLRRAEGPGRPVELIGVFLVMALVVLAVAVVLGGAAALRWRNMWVAAMTSSWFVINVVRWLVVRMRTGPGD